MSKEYSPYFVEFVGLPGSGKSTLSCRLASKLRKQSSTVFEPTYIINEVRHPYLRPFYKLPYVAYSIAKNPDQLLKFLRHESYRSNFKLIFNWFFVQGINASYTKGKGITIYDQGLIQAIWSFLLTYSSANIVFIRDLLLHNFSNSNGIIVCVEANKEIIRKRLSQRKENQSRVAADEQSEFTLNDALVAYDRVMEVIDVLVNTNSHIDKLLIRNEKQQDLEQNVKAITQKLNTNG